MRLYRRSNRSAMTPPRAPKLTWPTPWSPATAPTHKAESVVSRTSHPWANISMDMPREAAALEAQSHRKPGLSKTGKSRSRKGGLE